MRKENHKIREEGMLGLDSVFCEKRETKDITSFFSNGLLLIYEGSNSRQVVVFFLFCPFWKKEPLATPRDICA